MALDKHSLKAQIRKDDEFKTAAALSEANLSTAQVTAINEAFDSRQEAGNQARAAEASVKSAISAFCKQPCAINIVTCMKVMFSYQNSFLAYEQARENYDRLAADSLEPSENQ